MKANADSHVWPDLISEPCPCAICDRPSEFDVLEGRSRSLRLFTVVFFTEIEIMLCKSDSWSGTTDVRRDLGLARTLILIPLMPGMGLPIVMAKSWYHALQTKDGETPKQESKRPKARTKLSSNICSCVVIASWVTVVGMVLSSNKETMLVTQMSFGRWITITWAATVRSTVYGCGVTSEYSSS